MIKTSILIDGGYFLNRLPVVRRDVDTTDVDAVVKSIGQLIRSHLDQLNKLYAVTNSYQLLYRGFYYDARPSSSRRRSSRVAKAHSSSSIHSGMTYPPISSSISTA